MWSRVEGVLSATPHWIGRTTRGWTAAGKVAAGLNNSRAGAELEAMHREQLMSVGAKNPPRHRVSETGPDLHWRVGTARAKMSAAPERFEKTDGLEFYAERNLQTFSENP
jgi:hypothetical protein